MMLFIEMMLNDVIIYSTKHLVFGMDNGCVRIQPIHNNDPGLMGPYWSLPIHDNDYGTVTQLASSFNDKFIFSVGGDGNFFVFAIIDDKRLEQEIAQSKLEVPSVKVTTSARTFALNLCVHT